MRRMRFLSGEGNGAATVPSGEVTCITMVPGTGGSWLQINESKAIWVPGDVTLTLSGDELAACCGVDLVGCTSNDPRYPGDGQIQIVFGQEVQRPPDANPDAPTTGDAPKSWLVVYNGVW